MSKPDNESWKLEQTLSVNKQSWSMKLGFCEAQMLYLQVNVRILQLECGI